MPYKIKNIQIIDNQRYRKCTGDCGLLKLESEDNFRIRKYDNGSTYFNAQCQVCESEYKKNYEENVRKPKRKLNIKTAPTPEEVAAKKEAQRIARNLRNKQRRKEKPLSPQKRKQYRQNYNEKHHEEILIRDRARHKTESAKEKARKRRKEKIKNDPKFKWRAHFSSLIATYLKERGSSKNGNSTFDLLGYTLEDLLSHIESLFSHPDNLTPDGRVWMNFDNYGAYVTEGPNAWKDDNISTHRWSLDHENPESDFEYSSPDDPGFKEAWGLKNLRPYSAKQNVIDGATRIRHKKNGSR